MPVRSHRAYLTAAAWGTVEGSNIRSTYQLSIRSSSESQYPPARRRGLMAKGAEMGVFKPTVQGTGQWRVENEVGTPAHYVEFLDVFLPEDGHAGSNQLLSIR